MSARLWSVFRKLRVLIFVLCTILSVAWTVIYAIFLVREWTVYNSGQRAIMIILVSVNGLAAVLLYLMIIVHFRLWLDAARVAFLLLFQFGGTVTFTLFRPSLPCENIGSADVCSRLTTAPIVGGWVLSGLLLFYSCCLAFMSHFPRPLSFKKPESSLEYRPQKRPESPAPTVNSQTQLWNPRNEKHTSLRSMYSQSSFPPSISQRPSISSTTSSVASRRRNVAPYEHYGLYRPASPASTYSTASSSVASVRSHARFPYRPHHLPSSPYEHPYLTPTPSHGQAHSHPFPNPFADPIARHGSPMSISSNNTTIFGGYGYGIGLGQHKAPIQSPPETALSLTFGGPGQLLAPPPPYAEQRQHVPRSLQVANPYMDGAPDIKSASLSAPTTPLSLRPAVRPELMPPPRAVSRGAQSIRSMAGSMHMSVSQPNTPMVATYPALPSDPRSRPPPLPPLPFPGSYGHHGMYELRRYGSVPGNLVVPESHPQYYGGYQTPAPLESSVNGSYASGWSGEQIDRPVDFDQWRFNVMHAADSRPVTPARGRLGSS